MSRNDFWKKAGWFVVSLLPAALSLILQFGAAFVFMFLVAFYIGFTQYDAGMSQMQIMELVQNTYMENLTYVVAIYQVVGLLVFGLWYYLAYGRKKRPVEAEKPGIKGIALVVFLGCFLQVFISGMLGLISGLFPNLMKHYADMMELAGIMEMGLLTFITTVILAPIGEELLCRGIIFRLAGKVTPKFFAANCIQALAFGIIHANLVQGAYAFFLGLFLGYIYGKYKNISVCMLLHGVINCSSYFVGYLWELLPKSHELTGVALICALALVFMLLIMKLLGKIRPVEEKQDVVPC